MTQSRRGSFVESCINVAIGLAVSMCANAIVFPAFGWHMSASDNIAVSTIYTAISLVRSYCIRRWFNARIVRFANRCKSRSEAN